MLHVFSNSTRVGYLARGGSAPHRFTYEAGCEPMDALSLTMPCRVGEAPASFDAIRPLQLHPIFDMNMPEGALKNTLLAMYGKSLPSMDDYALLGITGLHGIGRVRCHPLPELPASGVSGVGLSSLLKARGTQDLFQELLQQHAQYSGVSGVQPKILVKDDGRLRISEDSPVTPGNRVTVKGATHIVKTFDSGLYPEMAYNEYVCLKAARRAGLETPGVELANDGGLLVIERFDLKPDGSHLGFEDGCALAGLQSSMKYEGSYEQMAKTLRAHLVGPSGQKEMLAFYKSVVLSCVVRNGDAHRKNFGVLYDHAAAEVRMAPAFDIITSTAYVESDTMALTIDGSKRWPQLKQIQRFGVASCNLPPSVVMDSIEEVTDAVASTRNELSDSKAVGKAMRKQWENGLETMLPSVRPAVVDQDPEVHTRPRNRQGRGI